MVRVGEPVEGRSETIAHLVYHTHWDREWYLTAAEYRRALELLIEHLLERYDEGDRFPFLLDGQLIIYLDLQPATRDLLGRYVNEGLVSIGPWLVLQDEFLGDVSLGRGEVLLRNLLLAKRVAEKLNLRMMKLGYLPDPFGHPSQLPQLLRAASIDVAVLWRGVGLSPEELRSELRWIGADGSELLLIYLVNSYGNGAAIFTPSHARAVSPEVRMKGFGKLAAHQLLPVSEALARLRAEVEALKEFATTRHVLIMVGGDHTYPVRPPEDMRTKLFSLASREGIQLRESSLEDFISCLREELRVDELPAVHGELRSSKYAPLLPNVLSTRLSLKRLNAEAVERLLWRVEPLSALLSLSERYPRELEEELTAVWLELMKCLPHDSLTGCSVDEVYDGEEGLKSRYFRLIVKLKELECRLITQLGGWEGDEEFLFNPYPHRLEVGELSVPAFSVVKAEELIAPLRVERGDTITLDNGYLRLTVNEDSWNLENVKLGLKLDKFLSLIDEGDIGDEYNFSPPPEDTPLVFPPISHPKLEVVEVRDGLLRTQGVRLSGYILLPEGLSPDRRRRSENSLANYIELLTWLRGDVVKFRIHLVNRSRDHRLRLLLRSGLKEAKLFTDAPFDLMERSLTPEPSPDEREVLSRWRHKYDGLALEKPSLTYPILSFAVASGEHTLMLTSKGLPELEPGVEEELLLGLTLLRSVGWLSVKDPEHFYRPNYHAGPEIATPGAQEIGHHVMELALGLWEPSIPPWELYRRVQQAWIEPIPLRGYKGLMGELLELSDGLVPTSIRGAADGLILRFFNPEGEEVKGSLRLGFRAEVELLNALEVELDRELIVADGMVSFSVKPKEIVSLHIKPISE